ncbi:DUF1294 domain-containing protein [Ferrimonas kyonanensis]|uniref:DUF1294 domain-containing protein n=1 Tax=Ferrimonas kyonanensis TaxID=364763 RepID=UPI0003FBB7D3|nr:DUF1294 domain-containing protein [Ferrimonas kyonanensis]
MPLGLLFTLALLPLLLLGPLLSRWPQLLLFWLGASLVAFLAYAIDKRRARLGQWRIPEKWLQLLASIGGWSGALLGQQYCRHKTRKLRFQIPFWIIGLVQWLLMADWGWLGGIYSQRLWQTVISWGL